MRRLALWLVLCAAGLGLASKGEAQRNHRPSKAVRFDVHLDLGFHGAFGVGGRVDIPVVPQGLIDGVEDELVVSPGAELFFFSFDTHCHGPAGDRTCDGHGGVGLWPLAAVQWNFYVAPKWSVFPELGLALILFDDHFGHDHGGSDVFLRPFLSAGGRYHFSARNALLLRIGWPAGLQVGLTF